MHVNKLKREAPIREWRRSLASLEDDEWRRVRHAIAPAFKPNRIKAPAVLEQIQTTIDRLLAHIERITSANQRCDANGGYPRNTRFGGNHSQVLDRADSQVLLRADQLRECRQV